MKVKSSSRGVGDIISSPAVILDKGLADLSADDEYAASSRFSLRVGNASTSSSLSPSFRRDSAEVPALARSLFPLPGERPGIPLLRADERNELVAVFLGRLVTLPLFPPAAGCCSCFAQRSSINSLALWERFELPQSRANFCKSPFNLSMTPTKRSRAMFLFSGSFSSEKFSPSLECPSFQFHPNHRARYKPGTPSLLVHASWRGEYVLR